MANPARAFLAFAFAIALWHSLPVVVPHGELVDLATPVAVVGTAALVLRALRARGTPLLVAVLAGIVYTSGHGIHLAANSIADRELRGEAADVAYFWDERFGHVWWHLGWLGLLATVCLAERAAPAPVRLGGPERLLAAGLLAFALFTNTVEGQTWWLGLGAAVLFCSWALARPRPLLASVASAFVLDVLFLCGWAAWHGGVPQFSDLGWM